MSLLSLAASQSSRMQYVALTFYMELMNADLPQLADFLAYEHDKCMFDGTRGSDLAEVSLHLT